MAVGFWEVRGSENGSEEDILIASIPEGDDPAGAENAADSMAEEINKTGGKARVVRVIQ